MYQWIWLNKLYKLMENIFLNFGIIFQINFNQVNQLHFLK